MLLQIYTFAAFFVLLNLSGLHNLIFTKCLKKYDNFSGALLE